jgi:hypothetical protein
MGRFGVLFGVVLASFGCSGNDAALPTAATAVPGHAPAYSLGAEGSPSNLSAPTLSGIVTDGVRGHPVGGVTVEIPGIASTVTNGDGAFTLEAAGIGSVPLVVRGDSFHARETRIQLAPRPAEIDLLPTDGDFDLDFFDHVFRRLGEHHTERWTQEPRFEIWTSVYERVEGEFYGDFVATEELAPERFIAIARDVIAADAPKYTGGFVLGSDVVVLPPHPPGTRLTYDDYFKAFTISVLVFKKEDFSAGPSWAYESGRIYSASIWMLKREHKDDRQVFSHELAHTLGFHHPAGSENVPRPSIMRNADDVTAHDVLHGRILYRRPPGSRTADKDPESFVINALRADAETGPPDPSRIRWVRN